MRKILTGAKLLLMSIYIIEKVMKITFRWCTILLEENVLFLNFEHRKLQMTQFLLVPGGAVHILDAIESALTGTLFFHLYLSDNISANIECFFASEKHSVPVKFTLKQFKKFCPQKKKWWGVPL